jgi:hypothetical protein
MSEDHVLRGASRVKRVEADNPFTAVDTVVATVIDNVIFKVHKPALAQRGAGCIILMAKTMTEVSP